MPDNMDPLAFPGGLEASHFFHMVEKLGVISNELEYFINTLEYYMGVSNISPNSLETKIAKSSSPRWRETSIMHQTSLSILSSTKSSFKYLINAFTDALTEKSASACFKYYAVLSRTNKRIKNAVFKMASLNHKLLQIRQSGIPKFNPTPPYVKRYQNIIAHDFMSRYVNDQIIKSLNDCFYREGDGARAILLWEHTTFDTITWERPVDRGSERDNLIILESFFALELPINLPHHIHEVMHYYLEFIYYGKNKHKSQRALSKLAKKLRKNILDFSSIFGLIQGHPEIEYICDFLTYIVFGEAYIISIYYTIYAYDAEINLTGNVNGDLSAVKVIGNIPTTTSSSWWIRLKVLVEVEKQMGCGHYSGWIKSIEQNLDWYHNYFLQSFPVEFADVVKRHITVEKNLAALIVKEIRKLEKNDIVKNIKELSKDLNDREKGEFKRLKFKDIFNKILEDYAEKSELPIEKLYTFSDEFAIKDIPLAYYKSVYKQIAENIKKRETVEEKQDYIKRIAKKPVPAASFIRYIARCWLSKEKGDANIFNGYWPSSSKKPPLQFELDIIKYKIDKYYPQNNMYGWVKPTKIYESIDNFLNVGELRQAYLSFGNYNIILFRPNVSAKLYRAKESDAQGMLDCRLPHFISAHSLIRLDFNGKNEVLGDGIFSCMVQSKILTNKEFSEVVKKMDAFLKDKVVRKHRWALYTSAGWEDVVLVVNNLTLERIKQIKKDMFNSEWCQRTATHIMIDIPTYKEFKDGTLGEDIKKEMLRSSAVEITTKMRVSDYQPARKNAVIANLSKKLREKPIRNGIEGVYLTPGSHDIMIRWKNNQSVYNFLERYFEVRESTCILKEITDIETNFMWRLLTADNQN